MIFRFTNVRVYSTKVTTVMKYLNVAEKNDAAKSISAFLSNGTARRSEGLSVFNKIYSFQHDFKGNRVDMIMTSVSGHLMTHEFVDTFKGWQTCNPISLFEAPVYKKCPENYVKIRKTLEREVSLSLFTLWLFQISVIFIIFERFVRVMASLYGPIVIEKVKTLATKSSKCVEL